MSIFYENLHNVLQNQFRKNKSKHKIKNSMSAQPDYGIIINSFAYYCVIRIFAKLENQINKWLTVLPASFNNSMCNK